MAGKIEIIGEPFVFQHESGNKTKKILVKCFCGKEWFANFYDIRAGRIVSCGCFSSKIMVEKRTKNGHFDNGRLTHGKSYDPIYRVYISMKQRCFDKKNINYFRYGGRGITVCSEWKSDFKCFLDWAMENGYQKGLQIDRIDNDSRYSPDNCRFVTAAENMKNTGRKTEIIYNDQKKHINEWAEILNIPYRTIYNKHIIQKMSMDDVIRNKSNKPGRKKIPFFSKVFHKKLKKYIKETGRTQRWLVIRLQELKFDINDVKLSEKINGKTPFSKEEIEAINKLLDIEFN